MQERRQCLLLVASQRSQKWPDGGKTAFQKFLANGVSPLAEVKRIRSFIASFATLNKAIGDKPINEAHCPRVGQAKDAPQFIVGWAQAVSDDNKRRGRLTNVTENVARRTLDAIGNGKGDNAEQIGSTVNHPHRIRADRTLFNLTLRALRT